MHVRAYSLFKSGHLSTNIKLMLYKALIRSVMPYACRAWEQGAVSVIGAGGNKRIYFHLYADVRN
jgi:hypothetical protein